MVRPSVRPPTFYTREFPREIFKRNRSNANILFGYLATGIEIPTGENPE